MDIIVCGAGQVGAHAAEVLATADHAVTLIDSSEQRLEAIDQALDIRTLTGNAANADVLREGGAGSADLLVACTAGDEINLLCASLGKALGAGRTIARVHHSAYFNQRGLDYRRHLGIDSMICPDYSTAQAIAATLRNPGALAIESFARSEIQMQELAVDAKAPAVGKRLAEIGLKPGLRLAAVERVNEAFIPNADTVIEQDDTVILIGDTDVFESGRNLFSKSDPSRKRVILMGGPSTAVWLCRALHERRFAIRLFEQDPERAEELSTKLDWVTVIRDDPTDPSVFEEEHIGEADVFVGLAGDEDARNIISCASAKSMGVKQAIAVVQQPGLMHLLKPIGIDAAFTPKTLAAREIVGQLGDKTLLSLATVAGGTVNVYRARVGPEALAAGKPLRQVKLTPNWMIAAIEHGETVRVPRADDVIEVNDIVLVIGMRGMEDKLRDMLGCN